MMTRKRNRARMMMISVTKSISNFGWMLIVDSTMTNDNGS